MSRIDIKKAQGSLEKFYKSIWFFPLILLLIVVILSSLQISGSSIGAYHELEYGNKEKDNNLILNSPRYLRSDEWLVTTQLTMAQLENNFNPINENLGDGVDMSLIVDAPTFDVGQIFKPQNWSFFFLSPGFAFALKWWLLAYFLIISTYFLVLTILPGNKKIAILIALGFAASPFVVWWYQYITLAPLYYAMFGIVVVKKIIDSKDRRRTLLWSALLAYIVTSFILVLYPPFQIASGLVVLSYLLGYAADNWNKVGVNKNNIIFGLLFSIILTIGFIAITLIPKVESIKAITGTVYPGNRITSSGLSSFPSAPMRLFLGNLSPLMQDDSRVGSVEWVENQSEGSTFFFWTIFLLPLVLFFLRKNKKIQMYWSLVLLIAVGLVYMMWMFIPNLDLLGILTLLNRVPQPRLLIGFGLINLLFIIMFIKLLQDKVIKIDRRGAAIYASVIFVFYLLLDLIISQQTPELMGTKIAILLAFPYAVITYLFLRKKFILSMLVLFLFSLLSVVFIHPVYRGVDVLINSEVSRAINDIDITGDKLWITDKWEYENIALIQGKKTLSGTYVHPNLNMWNKDFPEDGMVYNRYAHIFFAFSSKDTFLTQPKGDVMIVNTPLCGEFMKNNNIGYVLTMTKLDVDENSCIQETRVIERPVSPIYIYRIGF